jgi:hypothetical protein
MQHVHVWRSERVRMGLNRGEWDFWSQHCSIMHIHIVYKVCYCGAVLL